MPSVEITYVTQYNGFEQLSQLSKTMVGVALDRGAAEVEQDAAVEVPFLTGALRASRYRITSLVNEFESAINAATKQNPKVNFVEQPVVAIEAGEAVIGFAVDYAIYVHEGTHEMPARPFLQNAVARKGDLVIGYIAAALADAARRASK